MPAWGCASNMASRTRPPTSRYIVSIGAIASRSPPLPKRRYYGYTYYGYTYQTHRTTLLTCYLKERTGDMAGALGLILEALHRALRQLLPEVTA